MHGTLLEMGFMVIPPFPPYLFKPQKVMMLWQKWNHKRLDIQRDGKFEPWVKPAPTLVPWLKEIPKIHLNYLKIL